MVKLSVVIPFYNESANSSIIVDKLSESLGKKKLNYEIVAVDNGSFDDTPQILTKIAKKNKRVKIVTVKKNIGYGYGVKQGLKAAEGEFIAYMWADDFSGAKILPSLVNALEKSDASLAKVRRLERNEGLFRATQSLVYNALFRVMFNLSSGDINGCPKLMKNTFYRSIKLKSNDWFLDPEIMIKLKQANLKFIEIPNKFEKRKYEKSHVRLSTGLEFLKNMIKYKMEGS